MLEVHVIWSKESHANCLLGGSQLLWYNEKSLKQRLPASCHSLMPKRNTELSLCAEKNPCLLWTMYNKH